MEYMASRRPIVAFDLPETRFSAGDAALYADPGDVEGFARQLQRVLTDHDLRAAMLAEASKRIERLRWEQQVPALLAAYRHALSRGERSVGERQA
jgi:glycosyltransferase involved in cell wall biosynthesis